MSFEINKLICALLVSILLYLLSSFIGDLLYNTENLNKVELSYYIEDSSQINTQSSVPKEDITDKITLDTIEKLIAQADLNEGAKFVKKNCSACHDYNLPIKNKIGPSLATVLNRNIGSLAKYKYSKTFLNNNKEWSLLNLYLFLENPKEWAPGTKMAYRGIKSQEKLINTIKFLEDNSKSNEN
jgi:cytochrome c